MPNSSLKMTVAFSVREKREITGAPVSGSSWSPITVFQPSIPFFPGIFCVWPAAERHCLCCKRGSLGDSIELTELPLFTDIVTIEKDKSRRMFLLSNEVQTQNSWDLAV